MTEILIQLWKYAEEKLGMRNLLLLIALLCAGIYLLTWPTETEQDEEAEEVQNAEEAGLDNSGPASDSLEE